MKNLFFLLFSITFFAQSKPIELKIDSIQTTNTDDGRRKFVLYYNISNLTDKPISFVLNNNTIIPIGSGSLRPFPYYKVYENETPIDISTLFTGDKTISYFKNEAELNRYQDSIMASIKNKTLEQLHQEKKETFLNNIQKMEPKETKNYEAVFVWDKNRYHRNDTIEYYLEEKEKHYIELHINLMTEELLMDFTKEEIQEILKDKHLTKGWFSSNKVELNLGE
ncbi:hypothetical protein [Flavobacterium phycosphaerae]|uniref:hypothetical protein n=1 Tax=Flavobacterium phycosphaerae TaxID=2697515 RepID=UPI00138A1D2F|nr:hypothetical protein [Flavobacterium phycosphaerae]